MKSCSVSGCSGAYCARGFCKAHYYTHYRKLRQNKAHTARLHAAWYSKRRTTKWGAYILPVLRKRASEKGVAFSLSPDDISLPEKCPILGVPLVLDGGRGHPHSPSVDRLVPEKGYVPGNVAVISRRANAIKNDATKAELLAIVHWMTENGA